jgi:hypothetical protein
VPHLGAGGDVEVPGVVQDAAVVAGLDLGQLVPVLGEHVGQPAQVPGPARGAQVTPAGLGRVGGADGAVDVVGGAPGDGGPHPTGGGVDAVEHRAVRRRDLGTVDGLQERPHR